MIGGNMLGKKLTEETYTEGAIWCNENNAQINPDTWVIEEIPDLSIAELKQKNRNERNWLLRSSDEWGVADRPQTDEVKSHLIWREYLRNYTNAENWWENPPLTYEEWKLNND